MSGILIIGCGTPGRGDDAAGIAVARRLRERGIAASEHSGDGADLLEAWSGADTVFLVDAVSSGAAAGTVTEWDARTAPVAGSPAGTHAFGVAEAVGLARVLGRLPASLTIIGIEAASFAHGAPLTPEVERAVESVSERLILVYEEYSGKGRRP